MVRDIRAQKVQFSSAEDVFQEYGYRIPDTLETLTTLPGVGIKTAKVVLATLYGQQWIAVDTHVHRVVNRLGIVKTAMPEQTTNQLETIIPNSYKDVAHRVLIYFGRYHCTARNPKCGTCPFQQRCPRYNNEQ